MPTAATLERFVALVEANAHGESVEQFYTEGASMQENHSPPRVGLRRRGGDGRHPRRHLAG